jgi:hypothetical protein
MCERGLRCFARRMRHSAECHQCVAALGSVATCAPPWVLMRSVRHLPVRGDSRCLSCDVCARPGEFDAGREKYPGGSSSPLFLISPSSRRSGSVSPNSRRRSALVREMRYPASPPDAQTPDPVESPLRQVITSAVRDVVLRGRSPEILRPPTSPPPLTSRWTTLV